MDKSGAYSIHDKADTFANIFDIFFSNPALNSSKESTVTLARTVNKKTLKSSKVILNNSALKSSKEIIKQGYSVQPTNGSPLLGTTFFVSIHMYVYPHSGSRKQQCPSTYEYSRYLN